MKISTKGRYAVRLLVDLAEHQENGYVSLKDIAARQEISKKYLEQIVAILNRPGILRTSHGQNGGYRLAKPANQYTVGEILRITEGGIAPVACLEDEINQCGRAKSCATLPIWTELYRIISEYLDSITIQDILDKQRENYEYDFII